ncbi:sodium/proton antiporter (CPA1 family) [Mucilaginibacter yixingensis]|uniref:Sodium/proton antiporter (CPA1 family) n=1 Tax=Mucilaginibacter yixingensis TaxID=1295612 RepID=A0A2T5J536_9SPHI|nr:sodium:proton antiporter [Mucilaginibacter yixingensis]PTQ92706.1 sodium/proton antiporter (CPA1 family) [Mucilaginibacter yixingensis]
MHLTNILPLCIVLAAIFAYVNYKVIRWPPAIGIMVLALASSVVLVLLRGFNIAWLNQLAQAVNTIDFKEVLLNFMLSFLLFAGAIHLDAKKLHLERLPVTVLALFGTIISAALVGYLTWLLFGWFSYPIPLIYCLIFGTIISPTDPVAVLSILREARIPESLELKIAGESLFNDGVGVVLFVTMIEVAHSGNFSAMAFGKLFLQEAGGGLAFGALLGYAGFIALRSVDDYKVEVLITLALVTGGYWLADQLHVSGPLAMVVAGLITGNKSRRQVLSATSWDYLGKFWELVDEIMNAILFMLVGLEMLVVKINPVVLIIGLAAIIVMLLSRWISVALPVWLLKKTIEFERHATAILTWGGLKGGLSIALALSLPGTMFRDTFVQITYIIVVFSILVQGLTIGSFTRKLMERPNA